RLTASTMASTASTNSSTRRVVARRAWCWYLKKSIDAPAAADSELDRRRCAGLRAILQRDFQQAGRLEVERPGHQRTRESLALVVVIGHRIIERLAGKADAVLGAGQLLAQLQ